MGYSRMVRYLHFQHSFMSDMAVGLYVAVERDGLGLPSARAIAEQCRLSPSSLSRRLGGAAGLKQLLDRVVTARCQTHPGILTPTSWAEWLPQEPTDLTDARVWAACEDLALKSTALAADVVHVWALERRRMRSLVPEQDEGEPHGEEPREEGWRTQACHALVMGLTRRMCLEPGFGHAEALAVLEACVTAWAPDPAGA